MKAKAIEDLATRFRTAIERCDKASLSIGFSQFPVGSCGDASLLLARYLRENGVGDFKYVLGVNGVEGDRHSHAWLEQDGLIVDITADQFDGVDASVIVSKISNFHTPFVLEDGEKHPSDYGLYDQHTVAMCDRDYSIIMHALGGLEN